MKNFLPVIRSFSVGLFSIVCSIVLISSAFAVNKRTGNKLTIPSVPSPEIQEKETTQDIEKIVFFVPKDFDNSVFDDLIISKKKAPGAFDVCLKMRFISDLAETLDEDEDTVHVDLTEQDGFDTNRETLEIITEDIIEKLVENKDNSHEETILNLKHYFKELDDQKLTTLIWIADYLDIPLYLRALLEFLCENKETLKAVSSQLPPGFQKHCIKFMASKITRLEQLKPFTCKKKSFIDTLAAWFKNFFHIKPSEEDPLKIQILSSIKYLDLSGNKDINPDNLLEGIESLEKLNLGNCDLKTLNLPDNVKKHLKYLDLSQNQKIQLPDNFFEGFESLETLYLESCELSTLNLPDNMKKTLKHLCLSQNQKIQLPNNFFEGFESLETLYLESCELSTLNLPDNVKKRLKRFSIRANRIINFDNFFEGFECLEYLDLSSCKLNTLSVPDNVKKTLKHLNLYDNKDINFDNFFEDFENLEVLGLGACELSQLSLPDNIKKTLKLISLSCNPDIQLDGLFEGMENLENLHIGVCELKTLNVPDNVKKTLKRLRLYDNQNIQLPDSFFQGFERLEDLDLKNCRLSPLCLPNNVKKTLKHLDLSTEGKDMNIFFT